MLKDFIHFLTYGLYSPPETIVAYEKVTEVVTEEKIVEKLIPVDREVIKTVTKEVEVPLLLYGNVITPGSKVILRVERDFLKEATVYLVIDVSNSGYNKNAKLLLNSGELALESDVIKVDANTPLKNYKLDYKRLYALIDSENQYNNLKNSKF